MTHPDPAIPACTPPSWRLPEGACDAHSHVFGPFARYPLAEGRSYTPPEATAERHAEMMRTLGLDRGVVVQGSAHGTDNRAIAAAVAAAPDRLRGVGVVDAAVSDDELAALKAGGVVGMRFTEIVAARYGGKIQGSIGFAELERVGPRLREHGLHAQLFCSAATFVEAERRLLDLDVPLVIDHMGRIRPDGSGVDDPAFQRLLALVREGRIRVKLTVVRSSHSFPAYEDARPFHDALVEANPRQLFWGADWPLLNLDERTPDLGRLLDLFGDWVGDQAVRKAILSDNPGRFYFGER